MAFIFKTVLATGLKFGLNVFRWKLFDVTQPVLQICPLLLKYTPQYLKFCYFFEKKMTEIGQIVKF